MLPALFLLFLAVPFAEVVLLIKMASTLGFWPTFWIQVGTALAGAVLARLQGWMTWIKVRKELAGGRIPAEELVDGLLIFLAGLVLLTPGLITDVLGLLVLFPPTRTLFKRWLRRRFDRAVSRRSVRVIRIS